MEIKKLEVILARMKSVRMFEIPKCSFCEKPARVDGPTLSGQWGYMCENCLIDKSDVILVETVGRALLKKTVVGPSDDPAVYEVRGKISADYESQSITCPVCAEKMRLEIDASGPVCCKNCSRKLNVIDILSGL
jgi:hypothetical protein